MLIHRLLSFLPVVYKWGGIAFDDYNLAKMLILPSNAADATPKTFHDEEGDDYQVPVGKVFIVGKGVWAIGDATTVGRVGESDAADGAITKEVIHLGPHTASGHWIFEDIFGVYTAGKYVTAETDGVQTLRMNTALYGVEVTV